MTHNVSNDQTSALPFRAVCPVSAQTAQTHVTTFF
jgi:hypothetical protein